MPDRIVEDDARRIQIRALISRLARPELGRHELRGSWDLPRLRE
jgi:hypothetical protein